MTKLKQKQNILLHCNRLGEEKIGYRCVVYIWAFITGLILVIGLAGVISLICGLLIPDHKTLIAGVIMLAIGFIPSWGCFSILKMLISENNKIAKE